MRGRKRERRDPKFLTLLINGGKRIAVTVESDDSALTIGEWLRKTLEPQDGSAYWGEVSVWKDASFKSPVSLEETIESLHLFHQDNRTVVLRVDSRVELREPCPKTQLLQRIQKEDWGKLIASGGWMAMEARNRAVQEAVSRQLDEGEVPDVEEQLLFVKDRLRGKAKAWTVELEKDHAPLEGGVPMFRIGDELRVTIRCIDSIGLSADIGDVDLCVRVWNKGPPPHRLSLSHSRIGAHSALLSSPGYTRLFSNLAMHGALTPFLHDCSHRWSLHTSSASSFNARYGERTRATASCALARRAPTVPAWPGTA